jgi:hypothetical protein|tara:strand:+ start:168 stop:557 length:390 start_codon:yes stop_codon:yes gene_type:complete
MAKFDLKDNLLTYAAVLAAVGGIGAGFVKYGELTTAIQKLEQNQVGGKQLVTLTKSIENKADKTYVDGGHSSLLKKFDKWHDGKEKTVEELNKKIAKNDKAVSINAKSIEVLNAKIEEIEEKDANPLLD